MGSNEAKRRALAAVIRLTLGSLAACGSSGGDETSSVASGQAGGGAGSPVVPGGSSGSGGQASAEAGAGGAHSLTGKGGSGGYQVLPVGSSGAAGAAQGEACAASVDPPYSDATLSCCGKMLHAAFPDHVPPASLEGDLLACCQIAQKWRDGFQGTGGLPPEALISSIDVYPCCQALGYPPGPTCTPWGPPTPPAMPDWLAAEVLS